MMSPTEPTPPQAPAYHPGSLRDVFTPRDGYRITPILLIVNVLIFGVMVASGVNIMQPTGEALVAWGANFTPLTRGGQPWRLLTACFLHIGVIHLIVNMMSLRYLGMQIEPLLGSWRFLLAYVATGLTGSLGSLWWHDIAVSAGASGAIFGIEGVLLGLLMTNLLDNQFRKLLLRSTLQIVGINLLIGLTIRADNAAHLGGLLCGVVIGLGYYAGLRANLGWPVPRWAASTAFTVLIPVLLVALATWWVLQ